MPDVTPSSFGSVHVDAQGRTRLSPMTMGFDPIKTVEEIIETKTKIQTQPYQNVIDSVDKKVAALSAFEDLAKGYASCLQPLRGVAEGITPSGSLSQRRPQAYSTLSTEAAQGTYISQPLELLDLYVDGEETPSYLTTQVNRLAQYDQTKALNGFQSLSQPLGFTGEIVLNASGPSPVTVTLSQEMSLNDLMNAINTQTKQTGIMASYIAVSPTDNRFYFQATETGKALDIQLSPSLHSLPNVFPPDRTAAVSLTGVAQASTALGVTGTFYLGASQTAIAITPEMNLTQIMTALNQHTQDTHMAASILTYGPRDARLMIQTLDGSPALLTSTDGLHIPELPTDQLTRNNFLSAEVVYQGVTVTRPTNQITDLIPGGTLTLKKADPNTVVTITMTSSTDEIMKNIQDWITQHNKMVDFIAAQTDFNAEEGSADGKGILRSSQSLNTAEFFISDCLSSSVTLSTPSSSYTLADLGITVGEKGKLSLDNTADPVTRQSRLQGLIESNLEDVRRVLSFDWKSSQSSFSLAGHPSFVPSQVSLNGINVTLTRDQTGALSAQLEIPGQGGVTVEGVIRTSGPYGVITVSPDDPRGAALKGFEFTVNNLDTLNNNSSVSTHYTVSQGIADRLLQNFNQLLSPGAYDPNYNTMTNQGDLALERESLTQRKQSQTEVLTEKKERIKSERVKLFERAAQIIIYLAGGQ